MAVVTSLRRLLPPAADARLVRVSPDGLRLAYVRGDATGTGVFLADPETGWSRRLAAYPAPVEELGWSPDGSVVAYVVGTPLPVGAERFVAWAATTGPGEVGRAPGAAFAFSPNRPALFLADVSERALVRHDLVSGKRQKLAELADEGDTSFPSRIAVAADGKRIAFTARTSMKRVLEVWVLAREDDANTVSLVTKVPGAAVHVRPFWSPKGVTLGLGIVHLEQERSAILAVPRLTGDGEVLHTDERCDAPVTPVWSPSGHTIVHFVAGEPGASPPQRLALLDPKARAGRAVVDPETNEPPPFAGDPGSFAIRVLGDRHLAIDGGPHATILGFDEPL
jgi:dipeptidyl aminopeptidase/acylaminoacyl peptidase